MTSNFPPHKVDLLVYGPCSNAGDVLIHQVFVKLFESRLDTAYFHIRQSTLDGKSPNVVVGPGGLLSGSYKPELKPDELVVRHLTNEKVEQWRKTKRKIFCFGTGTNTPLNANASAKPFSKTAESIICNFVGAAQRIYLRGSADIYRLQSFCNTEDLKKFVFQPCPSLFLDRIYDLEPEKKDVVAVNLPLMRAANLNKHPIKRFIEFAHSEGLKVHFLDNHPMDFNPQVYDIFDGTTHSAELKAACSQKESPTYEKLTDLYQKEWMRVPVIANRFNGYRFAFGARLHSFLPVLAFDTPTVFLSANPIRMPMPLEYFKNPIFSAKYPYTGKNSDNDNVVDGMIDRLKFFIKNENSCIDEIRENKYRLWSITQHNMNEMLSLMA